MAILRIKDADGNVTEVLALRGEPGKSGVLTVNGIAPDENGNVEITVSDSGGIEVTGAKVGQTIVVKAVDENGKPTEWETADFPQGGAGGKAKTEKLLDVTFTEATASISVKLEHNFHKLFLVWNCTENARTVDAEGAALSGNKLGVILGGTSFGWNSRKVGMIGDSGKTWVTDTLLMEWTEDLSTYLGADIASISTGISSYRCSYFGGASALLGTIATSDAMAPISGSEICIVLQTGFFAPNTRIVLVGEYFE